MKYIKRDTVLFAAWLLAIGGLVYYEIPAFISYVFDACDCVIR